MKVPPQKKEEKIIIIKYILGIRLNGQYYEVGGSKSIPCGQNHELERKRFTHVIFHVIHVGK